METKCYQCRTDGTWIKVTTPPQNVMETIKRGGEPEKSLWWGYWNIYPDFRTGLSTPAATTMETKLWPDWIVVMGEKLYRVRYTSRTTSRCPSGQCGTQNQWLLFPVDDAARAAIEKAEKE